MNKKLFIPIIVLIIICILLYIRRELQTDAAIPNTQTQTVTATSTAMIGNLHVPWEILFLPTGEMLISERNGELTIVGTSTYSASIPNVSEEGEGGLMGLALHPQFTRNNWLYVYYTTTVNGKLVNRVERYTFANKALGERKVILDNIPSEANHNGGRIAFGPDGMLYITTGDAQTPSAAQDTKSLAGKILRVTDQGAIPTDNPFNNAVYSYGHRNSQGIAWDSYGNLWSTEHGRSGISTGFDELNLIEKGANYGWPTIQGPETRDGMKSPILHSGATTTWAPADIAFVNDNLYFTGLRGNALYKVPVTGNKQIGSLVELYKGQYGRLRAIGVLEDTLYVGTSNQDGRGTARTQDDRILRINVQ